MASKNIIADLNKGEKLNGTNYDIWHRKVQYLLNEQELLDHLTNVLTPPEEGTTAQHRRDEQTYDVWCKKDKSTCFTLLSCMHDDPLEEFENFQTTKAMWDQLRLKYGGTSATRLRALTLRFNQYVMDPKHTMAEHLRVMSAMIREMRSAGNDFTDEQQILAVIRSLPDPLWKDIKVVLTHNEGIKNFDDISRHLELEAERVDANRSATLVAKAGQRNGRKAVDPKA
ncbi:hypothetical protein RHGRI_014154 [Rhododendron griersonianum]|uniref:UBN2_2 domain-containing protein n=1 Tax=Rhododendron griersonianum TaxID=479676 RepID=A0AAV6K8L4_9ERIC|nr:hypothetical protein RHGRI_014154 [Rhododendron griersonianum]